MIKPRQINTQDYNLQKVQDYTSEAFTRLQTETQLLVGNFVTLPVATTDTAVEHGLRRPYVGWLVVDIDQNAVIYRSATVNPRPQDQVILRASVAANAKLYVF